MLNPSVFNPGVNCSSCSRIAGQNATELEISTGLVSPDLYSRVNESLTMFCAAVAWGYEMRSGGELLHSSQSVRGAALLNRVDYRLAETPEERDQVCALRYKGYARAGLISPSENRRLFDRDDEAPNAWTFGVYVDGDLCSSIRINVLTKEWRTSVACKIFGDILHPRLDKGEVFVDPVRLVSDPDKVGQFPELPYLTVRLACLACEYFDADAGVALVRPGHAAFYRRFFLHEAVTEAREFPGVTAKVAMMTIDFRAFREKVLTRFPIMRSTAFERRMLFERGSQRIGVPRPVLAGAA